MNKRGQIKEVNFDNYNSIKEPQNIENNNPDNKNNNNIITNSIFDKILNTKTMIIAIIVVIVIIFSIIAITIGYRQMNIDNDKNKNITQPIVENNKPPENKPKAPVNLTLNSTNRQVPPTPVRRGGGGGGSSSNSNSNTNTCTPLCINKACGDDGCGGNTCGTCGTGTECINFNCQAINDYSYPIFSNYYDNNGTIIAGQTARYNVSVDNTNGTVFINIDGIDFPATNYQTNKFSYSIISSNGTHQYYWWSYGTGANQNYNRSENKMLSVGVNNDNIYPLFYNIKDNTNVLEETGVARFNCSVNNTNQTVFLRYNNQNYAPSRSGNFYNVTIAVNSPSNYSYYWFSYGNGTNKNYNQSSTKYYNIKSDLNYPIFSLYNDNSGINRSQIARFNVTVRGTNGTVKLEFNGINYTARNLSTNVFNVTINITTAGNYNYRWIAYGNGTRHKENRSVFFSYVVNSEPTLKQMIYVSTTGSDTTGDGTITNPFKTAQRALVDAPLGNADIIFRNGIYPITTTTGLVRIDSPNITLRSYSGEWAHLQAPDNDEDIGMVIWFREESFGGKVQNIEVSGGNYYTIKFENFNWDQANSFHQDRNYIIEDSILHNSGKDIIKIVPGVDNVIIRRNTLYDSGMIDNSNADGIDNVNGNNVLVQDNYFYNIATNAMYAKGGAKNVIIERNLVMNSGGGLLLGFSTDAEFFDIDNMDSEGKPMYENIDGTIRNNIIINTSGAGIGLFAALRPQIYNNLLINTANDEFASIAIEPDIDPYVSTTSSKDVTIKNNIVVQSASAANPIVRIRCHSALDPCIPGLLGYINMSNNIYYKTGGAQPEFEDQRPGNESFGNLAGWKTHIIGDSGSSVINPNLDSENHIQVGSPAIDSGTTILTVVDDYDTNLRSGAYDIGADEDGGTKLMIPPLPGTVGTGALAINDTSAPIIAYIISKVTSGSATITWQTNEHADSQLEYGPTQSYGYTENDLNLKSYHSIRLIGLTPITTFHFRLKSKDRSKNQAVTNDLTFTTNPIIYQNITTSAGSGGTIYPSGIISILQGDNQQINITPNNGYNIDQVLVDGVSQGVINTYNFEDVSINHNITVNFTKIPTDGGTLPAGALLFYTFDETSGTKTFDKTGKNNNGTLINGAKFGNGTNGNCLLLDGVNDYLEIAEKPYLNLYSTYTVAAWIKRSRFNTEEVIYDAGYNHPGWKFQSRWEGNTIEYRFKESIGDGTYSTSDETVSDINWHHVALVKNGDTGATLRIYIDGVSSTPADIGADYIPTGTKRIGAAHLIDWTDFPVYSPFMGSIDNFVLYNRSLTSAEVNALYHQAGVNFTEPSCIDSDNDHYNLSLTGCGLADCNDNNTSINPSVSEICGNSIDEDCDSSDQTCISNGTHPIIPLDYVNKLSPEYFRFKDFVDQWVFGGDHSIYGYNAKNSIMMYRLTGNKSYMNSAIAIVENQVSAAEFMLQAGQRPDVTFDSYLYVGEYISDVAYTYDWAYSDLTQSQRTRWSNYMNTVIWNLWNCNQENDLCSSDDRWYWTGWSTTNPGNNYHYSFLEATMLVALVTQNQTWIDYLNTQKFPPLINYFKTMSGGGSREGTGYGVSHNRLFSNYRLWKSVTGIDLSKNSTHALDSIDFWMHATLPTLDRKAPIGDHPGDQKESLYDYDRHLMLEAIYLNLNTPQAERAQWWLFNVLILYHWYGVMDQMVHGFNYIDDILPRNPTSTKPTALLYYSNATGYLFARSSWDSNASWVSFIAGPYEESHAHHDQGSFMFFKNGWLADDEVIFTYSGISQLPELHNSIRFVQDGSNMWNSYGSKSTMTYTDNGNKLSIKANLTAAFLPDFSDPWADHTVFVKYWYRNLTYYRNNHTIDISDVFYLNHSVSPMEAVWQLNTQAIPFIQGDGTIIAGNLTIIPIYPSNPSIEIIDWTTVDPDEYKDGWRIDLRGSNTSYRVQLRVNPIAMGGPLPQGNQISGAMVAPQTKENDLITLKFNRIIKNIIDYINDFMTTGKIK